MKWLIDKRTTGVFGFALVVIAAVSALSLLELKRFVEASRWISRTQTLLMELEETRAAVIEAESAVQRFVITGDKSYLGPYLDVVSLLHEHLRHLKVLTAEDPVEASEITGLEGRISDRLSLLRGTIKARDESGLEGAPQRIMSGEGKRATEGIEARFSEIRNREENLLKRRTDDWQVAARRTAVIVGFGSAIALCMLALAVVATNREIAARKEAEEERNRFFVLSLDLCCVAEYGGYFRRLNPAWETTLGYTAEELKASPYLAFVHPEDREPTLAEAHKLTLGAPTVAFENRYRRKDGSYRWLSWTAAPFPERQLIYAVARDITERKQAEEAIRRLNEQLEQRVAERTQQLENANQKLQVEIAERQRLQTQLLQAQKMEAVGRLAGGVAHDFNNLLTIINGYSQIVLERLESEDRSRGPIEEIRKAGERAAALTRQLLAFSRRQVLAPQVLNLNGVIANVEKMLRRLIGEDVHLVTVYASDLGSVKADPGQLEQVIMNLAINARDAMPKGGRLTIETAAVELDDAYSAEHLDVAPGGYVMLAVSDTGVGMDAETQAHIFEPFFTTKHQGKGTGLGLATVYGIVKQSGGYIWVYSEPGQGTTFKIYLPQTEEAVTSERRSKRNAQSVKGTETILLVEDEASVRTMVRGILESNGYRVLEAPNGRDALLVCGQHKGPIHLLLSDVVMPGMSGPDLADALAPLHREMKVLYMSGYTDNAIVHHGVLDPDVAFLQKPFTEEALTRRVREVLDSVPGAQRRAA